MTVAEMHTAVKLQLDKSSSFEYASFLTEELDYWLNEAQKRFIKQRLYGNNYKQEKFDRTQKRIDDLRSLIRVSGNIALSTSLLGSNVRECALPVSDATNPYMFYINSTVYNVSGTALQTGDNIPFELISRYLDDNVNTPYIRRPLVTFYNNTTDRIAFVYSPTEFVPTSCDITYLKKPKKLVSGTPGTYETNTSELPEHTHEEIVVTCVKLLVENIESPRVQTYPQLNESTVE